MLIFIFTSLTALCSSSSSALHQTVYFEYGPLSNASLDRFHVWKDLRRNHTRRVVERRVIWSNVLVVGDGADDRVVLSDRKLSEGEYSAVLDAWERRRSNFTYVSLRCSATGTEPASSGLGCTCANFTRTNDSTTGSDVTQWTNDGDVAIACPLQPRLSEETFSNFDNVRFLSLSNMTVPPADGPVLSRLERLEALQMKHVSLSRSTLDSFADSICSGRLQKLDFVKMWGVRVVDSVEQNEVLKIFDCRPVDRVAGRRGGRLISDIVDHPTGRGGGRPLRMSKIQVRYCNVSSLTSGLFASLDPTSLLSVDLSRNFISSIESKAFANFANLLELVLSDNLLVRLPDTVLDDLRSVRYVDLAGNRLANFSVNLIKNNAALNLLNLQRNQIHNIEGTFTIIRNLVYVYLDDNRVDSVALKAFENCNQLMMTSLQHNNLGEMQLAAIPGMSNLRSLDLSMSRMTTTVRRPWNPGTHHLLKLILRSNRLSSILSDSFLASGSNVYHLDLSNNSIQSVGRNAFRRLDKLQTLLLFDNYITVLDQGIFNDLRALLTLDLSWNRIARIHESAFPVSSGRLFIRLNDNLLEKLPDNLAMPQSLAYLNLRNNRLTTVPTFARPLQQLDRLDLAGNRLTEISRERMANFPVVEWLDLQNNSLTSLPAMAFADNWRLRTLRLHDNRLRIDFDLDYFHTWYDFSGSRPKIDLLRLDNNDITTPDNLCLHAAFCYVTKLNLSNNPLQQFDDAIHSVMGLWYHDASHVTRCQLVLTHLWMRNCSLERISDTALSGAELLEVLDLRSNKLEEMAPLQIRLEHYTVMLEENPIRCSCRMKWLKNETYSGNYRLDRCYHAITGLPTPFATISVSEFMCKLDGLCLAEERQCDCYTNEENRAKQPSHLVCSERHLDRFPGSLPTTVKVVYFDGNNLTTFPTADNTSPNPVLTELHLSNNRIGELDSGAFESFPNLEVIRLDGNRLTSLKTETFKGLGHAREILLNDNRIAVIDRNAFQTIDHLCVLTLHANKLESISNDTMNEIQELALSNLTLHDNPWKCSCENLPLERWILRNKAIITTGIACNESFDLAFDCPSASFSNHVKRDAAIVFAFLLMTILTCLLVAYRHRHVLQVTLYSTRFRLRLTRPENVDCVYDAVIMYDSNNDVVRQWTENELRPRLLQFDPRFQLFVPDVDLLPGVDELNGITEGVTQSRRTIIVLDEGSYDNPYVLYAFRVAYHRMTTDDKLHDILIVLTKTLRLESLLATVDVDPNFKAYLTAGKCLRMSQRRFWSELNYFMPSISGGDRRLLGLIELRCKRALRLYMPL